MKSNKFILLFYILSIFTLITKSQQPIQNTNFVDGCLTINIDGNINEWEEILISEHKLNTQQIGNFSNVTSDDFSATYRLLADRSFLYIILEVTDDNLVFGESYEKSGKWWEDDCIEIQVNGNPQTSNQKYDLLNDAHIGIFFTDDQKTHINGHGANMRGNPSSVWHALGVNAAMESHETGYNVEIRIPSHILGLNNFQLGSKMGLNISVSDDDDGHGRDNKLCWSNDIGNTSYKDPTQLGQLAINSQINLNEDQFIEKTKARVSTASDNKIIVTLTDPGPMNENLLTVDILKDRDESRKHFNATNDNEEKIALALAILNNQQKWYRESTESFLLLKEHSNNPLINQKLKKWEVRLAQQFVYSNKDENIDSISNESITLFGNELTQEGLRYTGVILLESQKKYNEAIEFHKKVLDLNPEPTRKAIAYYDIGYNYKFLRNADRSIDAFSKCIALKSELPDKQVNIPLSYFEIGLAYYRRGDYENAIENWETLISEYNFSDRFFIQDSNKRKKLYGNLFIPAGLYHLIEVNYKIDSLDNAEKYLNKFKNEYSHLSNDVYFSSNGIKRLEKKIKEKKEWNQFIEPYLIK